MTVETNANFISDFNKAYPRNKDLIKEGDDHIRLVKAVLQNTFPGMSGAVNASSEKLNKLDTTFTYEGSTLGIGNSIAIAKDKDIDMGGNTITNIGDPEEPTDAVNLRSLQGSLMWPVGSIFITVDSRNPEDILGFGTWEKFAQGRVIVGTGSTTDINNDVGSVVNEQKGGTYNHTLTEDQLPKHKHAVDFETAEEGSHTHDVDLRVHSYAITNNNFWACPSGDIAGEDKRFQNQQGAKTKQGGAHKHAIKGDTAETGKGETFPLVQPFIGVNMWKRLPDA